MTITSLQKRQLKKQVHHLKPVVMLGQQGLTDNIHSEIDVALKAHELIKIRLVSAEKPTKQQWIKEICEQANAELIHEIGHVIAIYRKNPEK